MASYARRLAGLQEALAEAEQRQLTDRADQLRGERDAIARELRAAVGLGKRKRRLDDASEKARKAVSGRIRFAIGKLAELHPALGAHLGNRVRTGTRCRYEPDDGRAWIVR
ncbi:MAG: hypothetical protein M3Y87_14225 [Myxococcota bacterium]|nr:hypothetical protein [Myxococcota bacterium]